LSRTTADLRYKFSVQDSSISRAGYSLGKGLFTNVAVIANETIVYFEGKILTTEQFSELRSPNRFYTIQLTTDSYLDCYDFYKSRLCYASYANSPLHAYRYDGRRAVANAKLVVIPPHAKLVSSLHMDVDDEILWKYGQIFKFPEDC
jgi:hypothetical protein